MKILYTVYFMFGAVQWLAAAMSPTGRMGLDDMVGPKAPRIVVWALTFVLMVLFGPLFLILNLLRGGK